MKTSTRWIGLTAGVVMMLAGCAVQRVRPVAPAVDLPLQFRSVPPSSSMSGMEWWRAFGDPVLNELIERALVQSPEVTIAQARIAASRATLRQARASGLPHAGLAAGSSREQLSDHGLFGSAIDAGAFPDEYSLYRLGMDVSWEVDLFGAQRAQRLSAKAAIELAESEQAALALSIPAEVAYLYVHHLVTTGRLESMQRSIRADADKAMLLGERVSLGDVSEEELLAQRMHLEALRSSLPRLEADRESLRHAMGALVGQGGYVVLPERSVLMDDAAALLDAVVSTGTPSDLLRRRPDVRGAEARFRQAFAEHQYAIADQYPRFALFGSVGQESLRAGDLIKSASLAWSVVQQLTVPVLDGGRRSAVRRQRQAELDAAVAEYRRDVVRALTDVEQSLLSRQATRQALQTQDYRLELARRRLAIDQARNQEGDSSMEQVLDAEQSHELAWREALSARATALLEYVRLQKSLGGAG